MTRISVVIPVYKAENCLRELHRRLTEALAPTGEYEIILVEDCGPDKSWEIIKEIAAVDQHAAGLRLSRNFGQHNAITAGVSHATGDWLVVMDCDLQDAPENIPHLLKIAEQGHDIVYTETLKQHDAPAKRLLSKLFYVFYSRLVDYDVNKNFRPQVLFSHAVATSFLSMPERTRMTLPLLQWLGYRTASHVVKPEPRYAGKSSYSFSKLVRLALHQISAFSNKPLYIAGAAGAICAGGAFAYGIAILLFSLFSGKPIPGWSSIIVSLYFLGGLILFSLGIIGIYLARIFAEVKRRPLYLIGESTFGPKRPVNDAFVKEES